MAGTGFSAPDYRYNPFTAVTTPYGYGYSGNDKEEQVVPNTSPYEFTLNEIPQKDTPSSLAINIKGGATLTEVSSSTVPASGQFRVIYPEDAPAGAVGQGRVQFHSSAAGQTMEIKYYGLGAILQNNFFQRLFQGSFGTHQLFNGGWDLKSGGVLSAGGSMVVSVTAAYGYVNGNFAYAPATDITITAPGSDERLDYIVLNTDNEIEAVTGTAASTASFPSVTDDQLILGAVLTDSSTSSLDYGENIFTFHKGYNRFFKNVYAKGSYDPINKLIGNIILNDITSLASNTITCLGNCFITSYNDTNSSGSTTLSKSTNWTLDDASNWQIISYDGTTLDGTSGAGSSTLSVTAVRRGQDGQSGESITIKSYNVIINNFISSGGNGRTETNPSSTPGTGAGTLSCGGDGGDGGDGGQLIVYAVNNIEITGTVNLQGGNGGDGGDTSNGTLGNLGGSGGDGGNGGALTLFGKNIDYSGASITQTAGALGAAGTGSGGSNNNGSGNPGSTGSSGSITEYDYGDITGSPVGIYTDYADWMHPLWYDNGSKL